MSDCIFCKIIAGDIPSKKAYEDDQIVAFHDINPNAPVHLLIIPKEHVDSIATLEDRHAPLLGRMALVAKQLARDLNVAESGFRLVINTGKDSGQIVFHLHMHLLGGHKLGHIG